ncbi:hypothetical protein [Sphingomonas sp. DT-204]|uniref:hypothetical protein n=1 Tax=Sphingomonas sp. DT-204 TaxID=3396166 RepID=UPI003F1A2B2C
MIVLTALLFSFAPTQSAHFTRTGSPVFAPPPPIATSPPPRRSPTSRVREWTIEQRYCEKRRHGSCMMSAPDLLKPDVAPKFER